MFDLIIRGGAVYDGTGRPARWADVAVSGGKIAAVEPLPQAQAARVIDARGKWVTPGFIDIHRHADAAAFRPGFGELELRQGLTTIVNGNCGLSVTPCAGAYKKEIEAYLTPVAGALPENADFSSLASYLCAAKKTPSPINTAMLAGSGTIRACAAGFGTPELDATQMAEIHRLIEQELAAGALGVSLGLGYAPDTWDSLINAMKALGYSEYEMFDAGLVRKGKNGGHYDTFRNRLMFPVIDVRGDFIGFSGRILGDGEPKYMNSPETMVFNKSRNLFALNLAKKSKSGHIILAEGNVDVVMMHQAGFDGSFSSLFTSLTPEQARLISHYTNEVIIAYDNDGAGKKASQRAIGLLEKLDLKVKVLSMSGAKDPDEYIKKYGPERFQALLDGVGNALDFRLKRLRDQYDLSQDAQRLQYIKDAVEMLAERSNPTEQEVYAGRLAEETNISKTAIMAQLADAVKKAGSKRRREQDRARLQEGEMNQIKVPYSAGRGALGMASAEQRLLAAMLREPGYIDKVSAQLRPEQFLQPQQKELYEAMLRCKEQGVEVSLATLRAFVSEEALNELSRLAAQYSDVNCTPEDIKLYLERIARGTPVASRAASMSTNDIEQYLQSMREQKQGTADAEDSV